MYGRYSSRRLASLTVLAAAGASALTALPSAPARAETATVTATVTVTAGLILSVTGAISLTGAPGDTPVQAPAVTAVVTTNNPTGYNITVVPTAATLTGPVPNTIPSTDLEIQSTAAGSTVPTYTKLTFPAPLTIHNQVTPSAPAGDSIPNNYRILIPLGTVVGAYTGTITYVALPNS